MQRVNACVGFTYVHANFIFQQSIRILSAMPKILCACNNYFSADELTTGEIPEMENMQ